MSNTGFSQAWRTFWYGILGLTLLWIGAWFSSYFGAGGGLPDVAYGVSELSYESFTLPEDPILKIHVWERDPLSELREKTTLPARTPITTGPSIHWGANSSYTPYQMKWGESGLNLTAEGPGTITAAWSHVKEYDCGDTHTWWYSTDPDLTLRVADDRHKLYRTHEGTAEGQNTLCILWRGEGGVASDTVTWDGEPLPDARHHVESSPVYLDFTRDSLVMDIRFECRNLLGRLEAVAVVRATMVSSWREAGAAWDRIRADRHADEGILDHAIEKPTWTLELIAYRERGGES